MGGLIPGYGIARRLVAMIENNTSGPNFSKAPRRVSELRYFRRVFFARGMVIFGLVVLLLLVVTCGFR